MYFFKKNGGTMFYFNHKKRKDDVRKALLIDKIKKEKLSSQMKGLGYTAQNY